MPDWGNVPEWIAAVGSLGALAVALWLLGAQLRTYRTSEQDRIQSDATRVSAWWSTPEIAPVVSVHIRNAGDNPVYDCVVFLGPSRQPPPDSSRTDSWDFHFPIVPAGETLTKSVPSEHFILESQDHLPDQHGFFRGAWVEIVFTDSAGRFWSRKRDGQLVKRKGPSMDS